ncbi:MAG: hypothetical protein NVS4B10_19800 [Myxococcales bacterium]
MGEGENRVTALPPATKMELETPKQRTRQIEGEIDEIRLFLAPLILGGRTARDPLEGEGVDVLGE